VVRRRSILYSSGQGLDDLEAAPEVETVCSKRLMTPNCITLIIFINI
jgi:hypothetical protein